MLELPNKKYKIIYTDPPWSYNQFQGMGKEYGDVSAHYTTMTLQQLKELPINGIADKDCALFLWATFPNLREALELMKFWGFEYKTAAFVWVKTRKNGYYSGLGFYTNSNAEICLIGIKGHLERVNKDIKQLVFSPLKEHSRKPDEIRLRIVELYGNLPRIELFARQRYEGWDTWGNELSPYIQKSLEVQPKQT